MDSFEDMLAASEVAQPAAGTWIVVDIDNYHFLPAEEQQEVPKTHCLHQPSDTDLHQVDTSFLQ